MYCILVYLIRKKLQVIITATLAGVHLRRSLVRIPTALMLSVTQSFMEIVLREVHLFARQSRFLSASAALSQPAQKRTPDSHREKQQPQKLHSDIEQIETKYRLQPVTYAVDDFRSIINTEKDAKKVHIILLELESLRINGDLAPCYLNKKDMLILMDEASLSNRVKYLK